MKVVIIFVLLVTLSLFFTKSVSMGEEYHLRHGTASMAVLLNGVETSTVPVGVAFTLQGSGFTPGQQVYLDDLCYGDVGVSADNTGVWSLPSGGLTPDPANVPYPCTAYAFVQTNNKFVLVAIVTWDIY